MSAWVAIKSKAATEFDRAGPWKCEKSINYFLAYFPSHLEAHRNKCCWIWGNDKLVVPVQVKGVLSFPSPGEHHYSPSELPVHAGNEPQQEPQILLHVSNFPELWEISQSDLIGAWVCWHGSTYIGKQCCFQKVTLHTILHYWHPSSGSSGSPQKGRPPRTSRADSPSADLQPACVTSLQVPLVHLLKLWWVGPYSEVVPGAASECGVRYSFHCSRSQRRCQCKAQSKISLKFW